MHSPRTFSELRACARRFDHLTINGRWPDYLDVGYNVWMDVHDWHILWQQPLSMGRDAAGHYTIVLMSTVIVMRSDQLPNYVGIPYDNRSQ